MNYTPGDDELVCRTVVDVISIVPHLLGVQPENAMVLLPIANRDPEVPGCVQVEMPGSHGEVSQLVDALHGTFHNVLKDAPVTAFFYSHHTHLIGYMIARMRLDGLNVDSAVKVYQGHYWELDTDDPNDPGHPYVSNNIIDQEPPPFREDLVKQLTAEMPHERMVAFADYTERALDAVPEEAYEDYVRHEARWIIHRLSAMQNLLAEDELFRLGMATCSDRLFGVAWAMVEDTPRSRAFWTDVASRMPLLPNLTFLGAFANWYASNGTYASILLDHTLETDGEHRAARMLRGAMKQGLPGRSWMPPTLKDLPIVKESLAHG